MGWIKKTLIVALGTVSGGTVGHMAGEPVGFHPVGLVAGAIAGLAAGISFAKERDK